MLGIKSENRLFFSRHHRVVVPTQAVIEHDVRRQVVSILKVEAEAVLVGVAESIARVREKAEAGCLRGHLQQAFQVS